jgi:subtilisin-like proprotein convertase family protein
MKLLPAIILFLVILIDPVESSCKVFSNKNSFYVADYAKVYSNIMVSMPAGETISIVKIVELRGYHTCWTDIDMTLTSPQGTDVLFYNNYGTCPGPYRGDFANFLFDSSSTLTVSSPPFTDNRVYRGNFNVYNSQNPNGEWKLYFDDNVGRDCGTLCSWSLLIGTNGSNCSGTTFSPGACSPLITTTTTCDQIQAAFANGGSGFVIPPSQVYKKVAVKKERRNTVGDYFIFYWVNYSNSEFDIEEGCMDSKIVDFIYKITNNSISPIEVGSLDAGYNQYAISALGVNLNNRYYVAWNIRPESNYCNCNNSSYIGSGTFVANVKYFTCLGALNRFYVDALHNYSSAVIKYDDQGLSADLNGSSTFSNTDQLLQIFLGSLSNRDYRMCGYCYNN